MKKMLASYFTPVKLSPGISRDDLDPLLCSRSPLNPDRPRSAVPFIYPAVSESDKPAEAVKWVKNYNPESSASKIPDAVYQKRFQMGRIDTARSKKGIGSGILIAEDILLTARHCIDKIPVADLKVRFGIHKKGDLGAAPFQVSSVHAADSELAVKLGITAGHKADFVLLKLDTSTQIAPGKTYGFTQIKPLSEDAAKSGLYLLDYSSGTHLKVSHTLVRPVLLAKCVKKARSHSELMGKPIFWNDGQQFGRILSVTSTDQDAYVWIRSDSDTRSNKKYANRRLRISLEDGLVYNERNERLNSNVFVGKNILYGHDHIVVTHKAFCGGSGGVFFTAKGDIFAMLCLKINSNTSDLSHHVAFRPDVANNYSNLYDEYATLERKPEDLATQKGPFAQFHQNASVTFGVDISRLTVYIGFRLNIKPSHSSGHDKNRKNKGGNQEGSTAAADAHGIHQGNQWTAYSNKVLDNLKPDVKATYRSDLNALDALYEIDAAATPMPSKNTANKHSPEEKDACADKKTADKQAKKRKKILIAAEKAINSGGFFPEIIKKFRLTKDEETQMRLKYPTLP